MLFIDTQDKIVFEGKRKYDKPAVAAVEATDTSPAIPASKEVKFHFSWWYARTLDRTRTLRTCALHID